MNTCAIFGHSEFNYKNYENRINEILVYLIENCDVGEFLSGYRGSFDATCCGCVYKLKEKYPHIKNTLVLSYHPEEGFKAPEIFDGSVYLLERDVPPKYAIVETNKLLAAKADIIFSGVFYNFGGAFSAVKFAAAKGKKIYKLSDKIQSI